MIPLAIALIGFFPSYFSKFTSAEFGHHIHGLFALIWYAFVIYQPYLISKKSISKHKKYGLLGIFLAGMVDASGLAMIPGNISGAVAQQASGQISPIAPPFFLYGVSLFDLVAIIGFGASVIIAMIKSKQITHFANLAMITTPPIIGNNYCHDKAKKGSYSLNSRRHCQPVVFCHYPLGKAEWSLQNNFLFTELNLDSAAWSEKNPTRYRCWTSKGNV